MDSANNLGEALDFAGFDPEKIDVAEITKLSSSIPADGNVDISIAETLAVKFLRGADKCSEVLSTLTWWVAKKEDDKRSAQAEAQLVGAAAAGIKTATDRKAFSEKDPRYLLACEALNRAKAMKQWFTNKHESFVSAHYLMKDIAKRGQSHRGASGMPEGSWGKQEW